MTKITNMASHHHSKVNSNAEMTVFSETKQFEKLFTSVKT